MLLYSTGKFFYSNFIVQNLLEEKSLQWRQINFMTTQAVKISHELFGIHGTLKGAAAMTYAWDTLWYTANYFVDQMGEFSVAM